MSVYVAHVNHVDSMLLRCAVTDVDLTLIPLVVDIYHINLRGVSLSQFRKHFYRVLGLLFFPLLCPS